MKGASEETNTASTLIQNLYPPELWEKAKICSLSYLVSFSGEGNGNPLQYYCLENPMDGGAWKAAVRGVAKSRIRLSNFTFTFHFHALEKEMAAHSSVLAWRIPGTEEPGGLPSVFLPGESQGWGSLVGCRLWGRQSRTRLKRLSSSSSSNTDLRNMWPQSFVTENFTWISFLSKILFLFICQLILSKHNVRFKSL